MSPRDILAPSVTAALVAAVGHLLHPRWLTVSLSIVLLACTTVEPGENPAESEALLTETLIKTAISAEESYKFEAAAGHYQRLSARQPDSIEPVLGEARNLRYAGAPREALKVLRAGIEKHGEQPPLLLELAKAQFASALTADAEATIARLRNVMPDNWEVYTISAILADGKENYSKAAALYEQALALSPGNPSVINNYSLSLAQSGRLDEAIALLEPIAYGEYSTVQARQNMSMLYVLKGDYESAEKLANSDLPSDLALQNLGAYQKLTK
jgi:Flp pilus assembly protein TadD